MKVYLAKYGKAAVTSRRFIPNSNERSVAETGPGGPNFNRGAERRRKEIKELLLDRHWRASLVNYILNMLRIAQSGPPPQSPGSGVDTASRLNYRGFNEIKEKGTAPTVPYWYSRMFKPFKKGCLNCV